ncbi:DUF819 domain-containing protein [hydrothermal vent metagenome]|uniref:DUF819 domain-containing protein n=1 Tax=hydrothermal vent metagenome TaxID=652676 RepID=A0A1W1BYU4_9ZZZZ
MLFILAFFSVIVYLLTKRYNSKIITSIILFLLFGIIAYLIPISQSNKLLLDRIIANLASAMIFLYLLNLDLKRLLKNTVGCSCTLGAKRYWLIVFVGFIASFVTQVLAYIIFPSYVLVASPLFALVLGVVASFTPLRKLYGSEDVATVMLYLLAGAIGLRIF